jgi:hypothetical protein
MHANEAIPAIPLPEATNHTVIYYTTRFCNVIHPVLAVHTPMGSLGTKFFCSIEAILWYYIL